MDSARRILGNPNCQSNRSYRRDSDETLGPEVLLSSTGSTGKDRLNNPNGPPDSGLELVDGIDFDLANAERERSRRALACQTA